MPEVGNISLFKRRGSYANIFVYGKLVVYNSKKLANYYFECETNVHDYTLN